MSTRILHVVLRTAILVAVVASTALFVDYTAPQASFCGVQSACGAVKQSPYSHIGPVPLPAVGMGVFIGVYALALWASLAKHLKLLSHVLALISLGAVALIGIQAFVLNAFCAWCMAVDISAIAAAGVAALLVNREPLEELTAMRYLWGGVCIAAVAVPLMWQVKTPEATIPDGVAAHYVDGKVNVVTFTDFECPHCRSIHPVVHDAAERNKGRLNVVRLMMPLSHHPGAEPAALAYLCTPPAAQEAMASALYEAERGKLTNKGVLLLAKELGLDTRAMAKCVTTPETRAKLDAHMDLFKASQLKGLPSTFVGKQLIAGANKPLLMSAIDDGVGSDGESGGMEIQWMFALLAALLAGVVAISFKAAQPAEDPETEYA